MKAPYTKQKHRSAIALERILNFKASPQLQSNASHQWLRSPNNLSIDLPSHSKIEKALEALALHKELAYLSELGKTLLLESRRETYSVFSKAANSIVGLVSQYKAKIDNANKLNSQLKETQDKFKVINTDYSSAYKRMKGNEAKLERKIQVADSARQKLATENSALKEKIDSLEELLGDLSIQYNLGDMTSEIEECKKKQRIKRREIEALKVNKEMEISQLSQKIDEFRGKVMKDFKVMNEVRKERNEFMKIINNLEEKCSELTTNMDRYREIAFMASEDFKVIYNSYEPLAKIEDSNPQREEAEVFVQENNTILRAVNEKFSYITEKFAQIHESKYFKNLDLKIKRGQGSIDPVEIDLTDFKFFRPSLYDMLEVNNKHFMYEVPFKNWVLITIRGIYDSKFNQQILNSSSQKFPEFVFLWLGQFGIDKNSRKITELDWWIQKKSDSVRRKFLIGLSHIKQEKNWEVFTFTEFLNEKLMLDELVFYLHMRNLLFKGPQLAYTEGRNCAIHTVFLAEVYALVDSVLAHFSESERTEIKNTLKSKSKCGNKIDSSLALRVLLELYVREKKGKYLAVRGLFHNKNEVGIKQFRKICKKIHENVDEEWVIHMYYQTYVVGNGTIDPKTFFLVANEEGFFVNLLKLRTFRPSICLDSESKIDSSVDQYHYKARLTWDLYRYNKSNLELLKCKIGEMGLVELLNIVKHCEQCLEQNGQEPLELYRGKDLMYWFHYLWEAVVKASLVYDINRRNFIDVYSIMNCNNRFFQSLEKDQVSDFLEKVSVNRIQKFWKRIKLS